MKLGGWTVMLLVFCIVLNIVGITNIGKSVFETFNIGIANNGTVTSADVEDSTFWRSMFNEDEDNKGILVALGVAGLIIIGLFAKGFDVSLVYVGFIVLAAGWFIGTFWQTINYVNLLGHLWLTYITLIVFGGMAAGFIMACLNYFGGR